MPSKSDEWLKTVSTQLPTLLSGHLKHFLVTSVNNILDTLGSDSSVSGNNVLSCLYRMEKIYFKQSVQQIEADICLQFGGGMSAIWPYCLECCHQMMHHAFGGDEWTVRLDNLESVALSIAVILSEKKVSTQQTMAVADNTSIPSMEKYNPLLPSMIMKVGDEDEGLNLSAKGDDNGENFSSHFGNATILSISYSYHSLILLIRILRSRYLAVHAKPGEGYRPDHSKCSLY